MGELSVFVNHTYGSEQVFNRAGNQPGNWTEAVISIGSHRNFNVSFVGTLGMFLHNGCEIYYRAQFHVIGFEAAVHVYRKQG